MIQVRVLFLLALVLDGTLATHSPHAHGIRKSSIEEAVGGPEKKLTGSSVKDETAGHPHGKTVVGSAIEPAAVHSNPAAMNSKPLVVEKLPAEVPNDAVQASNQKPSKPPTKKKIFTRDDPSATSKIFKNVGAFLLIASFVVAGVGMGLKISSDRTVDDAVFIIMLFNQSFVPPVPQYQEFAARVLELRSMIPDLEDCRACPTIKCRDMCEDYHHKAKANCTAFMWGYNTTVFPGAYRDPPEGDKDKADYTKLWDDYMRRIAYEEALNGLIICSIALLLFCLIMFAVSILCSTINRGNLREKGRVAEGICAKIEFGCFASSTKLVVQQRVGVWEAMEIQNVKVGDVVMTAVDGVSQPSRVFFRECQYSRSAEFDMVDITAGQGLEARTLRSTSSHLVAIVDSSSAAVTFVQAKLVRVGDKVLASPGEGSIAGAEMPTVVVKSVRHVPKDDGYICNVKTENGVVMADGILASVSATQHEASFMIWNAVRVISEKLDVALTGATATLLSLVSQPIEALYHVIARQTTSSSSVATCSARGHVKSIFMGK